VTIRQGPTKADQTGEKRRRQPRTLPVTDNESCAGKAIRDLLVQRYRLRKGDGRKPPADCRAPLFQTTSKKQLTQRQVLEAMRKWLKTRYLDVSVFGTHSFRIGGFNHLFKMGIAIEVIKNIGGWASDAWREYLRVTQGDCLDVSRKMLVE
jgi:site-specific recombinase XerD